MSDTYIRCKNCYKDLKLNAILKHLCQKPTCKGKYSTLEYNDLVETARKRSKEKKKRTYCFFWRENDFIPMGIRTLHSSYGAQLSMVHSVYIDLKHI